MILKGDVEIPFQYENNSVLLDATRPTHEEFGSLSIVVITSGSP